MAGSKPVLNGQFPVVDHWDYLNHAGMAPMSGVAAEAVRAHAEHACRHSMLGSNWFREIEEIRAKAATWLNAAGPEEIAFIPNTSTGLAMMARGLSWEPGDEVIISAVEYPANRYPWEDLKRLGVRLIEVPEQPDGRIPASTVIERITERTRVVSLSHVQYGSGYRLAIRPIADAIHRVGGLMCLDAIQSMAVMKVDVEELGVDLLAAHGYKWLMGPEGAGFFYCRRSCMDRLHPVLVGWASVVDPLNYADYSLKWDDSAKRFEPGTLNTAGILGLGASMTMLEEYGIDRIWSRIEQHTARIRKELRAMGFRIVSPDAEEQERSGIVSFLPSEDCRMSLESIAVGLRKKKIEIAVRCGRLRVSPHFYNSDEQIDRFLSTLREIIHA